MGKKGNHSNEIKFLRPLSHIYTPKPTIETNSVRTNAAVIHLNLSFVQHRYAL